jgi:hypothetical protein
MILCRECGNSAPSSDGFCSSCGALLDWSGERVETRVLPAVQPTAQVWTPAAVDPSPSPTTTKPGTGPNVNTNRLIPPPVLPQQPAGPPGPAVTAPEPTGWIPTPEARRADPVPVSAEPAYTGPYCQACGVRNPEGRQFCRSCGTLLQLTALASADRRGWWRRLIDRLLRRRRDLAAGQRPAGFRDHSNSSGGSADGPHRRGLRRPRHIKLGKLAPILVVAGLAGIGLGPARIWVTNEVNSLMGRAKATVTQHYANVTPVGATADAEKDHAAGLAIDGVNTTYWASTQHTDGVGDSITVTFAGPVNLDQLGLLSGADPANFRASARPHDLTVSAAGVPDVNVSFDDTADFQNRALTLRHVTSVTITVKDSYPGQKQHDLAIRDLEFFVKSP